MDMQWGYNNIHMKEGDKHKAVFRIRYRHHESTVMYFGLTNSPAIFQMIMNEIFQDLVEGSIVVVYIDNILIFTIKSREDYRKVIR